MKKFMTILAALLVMAASAKAMSYEQARQQALFLTDKMAYELNLNDAQYEATFEINLDYLMGVNTYDDLYGPYWQQRNLDLGYILLDWQYRAYCAASYFYRPLYWSAGYWHFGIYARYPYRDYFFFDRPRVYVAYRGGHSWHNNGGRSWYHGRDFGPRPGTANVGMRDRFDRGDYGRGNTFGNRTPRPAVTDQNRVTGNGSRTPQPTRPGASFGGRESSTRTTVTQPTETRRSTFGGNRGTTTTTTPRPTFTPGTGSSSFGTRRTTTERTPVRTAPGNERTYQGTPNVNRGTSSFGGSRGGASFGSPSTRSTGSGGGATRSGGGSFGGRR